VTGVQTCALPIFEYQLGGIIGTDFGNGRGNVSLAMSVNTRELNLQRDNPFYRDLWADPDTTSGQYFFVPRPGVSGVTPSAAALAAAFPGASPAIPAPGQTGSPTAFYVNEDGSLFTTGFNARGGSAFFQPWAAFDNSGDVVTQWGTTSAGTLKYINAFTPQTVPTTRYNFLARGNYELNDWVGVFAQGMFSNNTTFTAQEPSPITFGWDVLIPWGSGVYTGEVPGFSVPVNIPGLPPFDVFD